MLRNTLFVLLTASTAVMAQPYDLLIKGGHLIDPKNDINGPMDVAIADGNIAAVAPSIDESDANRTVDAAGLYVVPGLIDIHAHVFWGTEPDAYLSNSFAALPPDGFTLRAGVTTVVDAGGAGWRNYGLFHEQTVRQSKTRVLAFINIVGAGMKGGAREQDLDDMDPERTASEALQFPGEVIGIKLAHFEGPDWEPVRRSVEAGRQAGLPVMIDFGRSEPPLPLCDLMTDYLRPGDIFTHCYADVDRREAIVDESGALRACMRDAWERNIIFDVGHGGGSFTWAQAEAATRQGLWPQTISTDLHTGSMNGAMKSMTEVMSKMLVLGMDPDEVIRASTWRPAQVIGRDDLGHLSVGAVADVAVLGIREGDYGYMDTRGARRSGTRRLETEVTLRAGEVVWDLNGLAAER